MITYDNATPAQRRHVEEICRNLFIYNQSYLVDTMLSSGGLEVYDIQNLYVNDRESEEKEIFEWWLLNNETTAERLKDAGEVVLITEYGCWWGRTTCGQAIAMDNVIWELLQDSLQYCIGE